MTRDLATSNPSALLLGISLISFNFSGWDNVSTFAAEVDRPQRNYPIALGGALLALVLCYLLPVLAGLSVTSSAAIWSTDSGWPVISRMIGGPWLGAVVAAAGVVSMWGLFNAQLLYVSRLPMARMCSAVANRGPRGGNGRSAPQLECLADHVARARPGGRSRGRSKPGSGRAPGHHPAQATHRASPLRQTSPPRQRPRRLVKLFVIRHPSFLFTGDFVFVKFWSTIRYGWRLKKGTGCERHSAGTRICVAARCLSPFSTREWSRLYSLE